jgi:opacity protein-like surface antigen
MCARVRKLAGFLFCAAVCLGSHSVWAQEGPVDVPIPSSVAEPEQRKTELYGALFILGTMPENKNLEVGNTQILNNNVKGSIGAGLKAGAYPKFASGYLGFEGELFGHGGKISSPGSAQGNLTVINSMLNVILRYPADVIQPYVGAGFGVSSAQLRDTTLQVGALQLTGKSTDSAFAYQFLGGVRAYLAKQVFVFGEYRYFSANYKWVSEGIGTGNPDVKLDFRTQIVSGGIGFTF